MPFIPPKRTKGAKRVPTFKQKKFVHKYIKHGNGIKAAEQSYNVSNKNTASAMAQRNLNNPAVKGYMKQIMDAAQVTDEKIAKKINKIIEAGTTQQALKTATPQHALKALDFAAKVKDIFPAERKQIDQRVAKLNIDLTNKSQEELQETLDNLIDESKKFRKMIDKTSEIQEQ